MRTLWNLVFPRVLRRPTGTLLSDYASHIGFACRPGFLSVVSSWLMSRAFDPLALQTRTADNHPLLMKRSEAVAETKQSRVRLHMNVERRGCSARYAAR